MVRAQGQSEGQKFAATLEEQEARELQPYALKCRERKELLKDRFRAYETTPLEYRTEYQRDRDRIIWSRAFKRLQHKTQIFPAYSSDHFRRRLTHVLEVSQVSTSLARALEINADATEAIALAHDIGHAPFGHGGEKALDEALQERRKQSKGSKVRTRRQQQAVPVFSFNHALQGVETVERVEKEYKKGLKGDPGLNLTFDVREGILKHRRFKGGDKLSIRTLDDVMRFEQYRQFGNGNGSLEAQCVLLADKITYFFEDFEDALRSHILECKDIHITLGDFGQKLGESVKQFREITFEPIEDIDSFLAFRRNGIATFILNAILNAKNLLHSCGVTSVEDAKKHRIVCLTDEIEQQKDALYDEYVERQTFGHHLYMTTEVKAKKIVRELFQEYQANEGLIPQDYREQAQKAYGGLVKDATNLKTVTARNYIAGMTDLFAIARHKDLFMSGEEILIA